MKEEVTYDELKQGFGFLVMKLIDMDLKTDDGHDICPMFGFCEECGDCFLDRVMEANVEPIPDNVLTPLKPEWKEFTNQITLHLNIINSDDGEYFNTCCDGSFKIARNLLENRFPEFDLEATITYFKKSQWFCDCDLFSESPLYLGEPIEEQGIINVESQTNM